MVDERAVEVACQVVPGASYDSVKAVIEAYEAARWRPIEEMPEDRSKIVIWYGNALYHGEDFAVVCNAMFRTIDPPTKDLISDHEPTYRSTDGIGAGQRC